MPSGSRAAATLTGIAGFQDWRLDSIDFTEDGRAALDPANADSPSRPRAPVSLDQRRDIDAGSDGSVLDVGERADGSFWLHWSDRILLLSPGLPARALDIGNRLQRGEWARFVRQTAERSQLPTRL